ncbi:MAG: terminase [Eubacteriales bacterium]|nr:terminase [Eubacteriales bacterium]
MAKDGTARGSNIKVGAGRKPKGLAEKLADGNPGGRKLTVIDLPEATDLEGSAVPEPSSYLRTKQKAGGEFDPIQIYTNTWLWLQDCGCDKLISKQLVEQYAMSVSRLVQCEEAISEYGFLSKHPTTGAACASPFVAMAQNYQKQVNAIWYQIYQVVRENCSVDFKGATPQDDVMEMLLRSKNGK